MKASLIIFVFAMLISAALAGYMIEDCSNDPQCAFCEGYHWDTDRDGSRNRRDQLGEEAGMDDD